jgi:hypothetical protein
MLLLVHPHGHHSAAGLSEVDWAAATTRQFNAAAAATLMVAAVA